MSDLVSRWAGLVLCAVAVVATLVLAATGQLGLYIHPRYIVFTVELALIGAVFLVAIGWFAAHGRSGDEHEHEHDHGEPGRRPGALRRAATAGTVAIVVVAAVAMLVVPPATLSADRAVAALDSTEVAGERAAPVLVGSDPTRFSLRDWATLLGQGRSGADLVGQRAEVSGFVILDPDDPSLAHVGRYAITCCAVDAQLFSVPVERSALPADIASGQWVRLGGSFADTDGPAPRTRLAPDAVERIEEPSDPYIS